jgi:hypothetical protein
MNKVLLIRVGALAAGFAVILVVLHTLKIRPQENPGLYFSLRYGLLAVVVLVIYLATRKMKSE